MNLDADAVVDRRRLKRALMFWRIAALVVVAALGALLAGRGEEIGDFGPYVAELSVNGVIVDNAKRIAAIDAVAKNDRAKALIVNIDSPGGTVVGGETLYRALRRVAAKKPVVAVMGAMATSGGYMTALGADRIIAHGGTLTGSIGVLLQTADVTGLMAKLGIKPETVKSSPLKAQPNPLEPFSPDARKTIRSVVMDMYDMFSAMVAKRRHLTAAQVKVLADGRVYTGRQAVRNGLVDQLGGMAEARAWLAGKGVADTLPAKAVELDEKLPFLDAVGSDALSWLGRVTERAVFGKMVFSEGLTLDGLVSVWHPVRQ